MVNNQTPFPSPLNPCPLHFHLSKLLPHCPMPLVAPPKLPLDTVWQHLCFHSLNNHRVKSKSLCFSCSCSDLIGNGYFCIHTCAWLHQRWSSVCLCWFQNLVAAQIQSQSPIGAAAKKEMKTTLAILSIFILFFSLTIDTTLINIANVYIAFLLVVTQLYKRVCLLVCGSIRWSIRHACFSVCKKRAKLAKMRSVMTR